MELITLLTTRLYYELGVHTLYDVIMIRNCVGIASKAIHICRRSSYVNPYIINNKFKRFLKF
jgi:uncharacterized protein (DUF1919 family)